jgi:microcystin-dependent protein
LPRNASGLYTQPASDVNPPLSLTTIDPVAFAAALTDIATELTNSLDRLGRGGMTAVLQMAGFRVSGVGAPTLPSDAARLQDISTYIPSGAIMDFAMNAAPAGWLVCDGTAYSRTTYAALFAAVGVVWGAGDGSTTFNVPDFRGTIRRSWDNGKGLDPSRVFGSYQADMLASHTHTQNPHNHGITDPGHAHVYQAGGGVGNATFSGAQSVALSGGANTTPSTTGVTINNATATNNATGGTETAPKNYAVLVCIRT